MASDTAASAEPPTFDEAITHAARLLANAELEADVHRMERVEKLADSWIGMAGLIHQRDRDGH
jgi:Rieske Fe-S protein